jgi:uncharacterized integral membrane protein
VRLRRRPLDQQQLHEIQDRWQPLLYVRLIVLGLLLAYAIAFVLENRKGVHIHFVLATARVSLIWLVLLSLAIGVVAGILIAQLERRSRRRRARSD